jgi:hypothetical protein
MNLVLEQISLLESNQGDGITVAGHTFHSTLDCERFLLTKVPTSEGGSVYCPSYDMVALVHGVDKDDSGKSLESVLSRDHHATKGGFSSIGAVVIYASMQQSVPGPSAGSADFPLPGARKFELYDKQDGLRGLRNIISRGVESKVSSLMSAMNRELRAHPDAMAVFRQLLLDGSSHWRALAAYLLERRNICFHQCSDEEEAWLFPCEVGRGVFDECYKARRGGAERSNTRELTIHDAARMFWGVLRTHKLLEDFVYHNFQGHPKLATYYIKHLFRNFPISWFGGVSQDQGDRHEEGFGLDNKPRQQAQDESGPLKHSGPGQKTVIGPLSH